MLATVLFKSSILSSKSNITVSIISGNMGMNDKEHPTPRSASPAHIKGIDGFTKNNIPEGPVTTNPTANMKNPIIRHTRL